MWKYLLTPAQSLCEMDLKVEPVWLEETENTLLNSDIYNNVDSKHFAKIEPHTTENSPDVENDSLDPGTEDDTLVNFKEETLDDEDILGETLFDDDGTSLSSSTADTVADPEKIFLKEEASYDDISNGSLSRLSTPVGGKVFPCSVCCKTYRRNRDLERHSLIHCEDSDKKVAPFSSHVCAFCDKTYTRRADYQEHMEMHNGVKNHECTVCHKQFVWRQSLRMHMMIHSERSPFPCKECPKSFRRPADLRKHMQAHSPENPETKGPLRRSHVCSVCKKAFSGRSDMKDHEELHKGVMKHVCSVCNKRFTWRQSLRMHMMIHNELRPHPCTLCSKAFRRPIDLRRHILTHTGERPHACTVCPKKFLMAHDLSTHQLVHAGNIPYACELCDKKYPRYSTLKNHILAHKKKEQRDQDFKPLSCLTCGDSFKKHTDLIQHMALHT
ncbi:zinc finger protein OZF [Anabrus simplex]|uniref:zinc finger protein OZF n=1 Tax=Anabrus simplex TaxID=316456 RepID=UPI0034DD2439